MAIINDAITTVDGSRDPRQRGKPGFAGCGQRFEGCDRVSTASMTGTFHLRTPWKTAAKLDVTKPLLPKERSRDWDTIYYFKEYSHAGDAATARQAANVDTDDEDLPRTVPKKQKTEAAAAAPPAPARYM